MLRLIVSRLAQLPLILAVVFLVTFLLAWQIPGNPLERPEGLRPDREIQKAMLERYNLHSPWAFAGGYLRGVFTRGDFGPSLFYRDQSVSELIAAGLPVSATLGAAGLAIGLFIGLGAGIVGALKPGSALDGASLMVALIGVSLPTFVTGSVLVVAAAGLLHWVPWADWAWPGWRVWEPAWWSAFGESSAALFLPALTLGLAPAAYIARLIRLGLADVMSSDYVRTARAKGVGEYRVLFRHALKVAFLPVLSFLGPAAAVTLTGSFIVEKVFNIPGMGEHFVNAVLNKDQFLILGIVLVFSTILILFNLLVDVAYVWVDPRIEVG